MRSRVLSTAWPVPLLVVALALVPAMVKLLCYPGNIGSDDAYIHLRIATNFVHGLGWGINPHEPVNLSTSPAFTLLLAAAEWASPAHAVLLTQGLSVGAVIAGLLLLFAAVRRETGSVRAALFAQAAAAFSVNLWRWNGALMEASFGFAVVAALLYLLAQRGHPFGTTSRVGAGLLLGMGLLLRPEMGLFAALAVAAEWLRSAPRKRALHICMLLGGAATLVVPWCFFASQHLGSVVPTTFAAKSTRHLLLVNGRIVQQFGESVAESLLFPTLLVLLLWLSAARRKTPEEDGSWQAYLLPGGWVLGLFAFYYLKTPGLQSTGRYVLPLLPAEAMLLGLGWAALEARLTRPQLRLSAAALVAHTVFAVALNYLVVMPVLQRFEPEYGAAMRAAADELARRVEGAPNRRVLVEEDIGVLSCAADGRFAIYDGAALATPELHGLSVREQIERVQPAFVVQSIARTPSGFGPALGDVVEAVWSRRFRQHSVRKAEPYEYAIVYASKEGATATARP